MSRATWMDQRIIEGGVMRTVTQWFDGEKTPKHIGIYQRNFGSERMTVIGYSHWNGRLWCFRIHAGDKSDRDGGESFNQNRAWRGLAENPATNSGLVRD